MHKDLVSPIALALVLIACGGDPTGTLAGPHLQFAHSEDREGSFSTLGELEIGEGGAVTGTGVIAAAYGDGISGWTVQARRASAPNRTDRVRLELEGVTAPGSYALGVEGCLAGEPAACRTFTVTFEDGEGTGVVARTYVATSGSVTVEAITSEMLAGRFEVEAVLSTDDRRRLTVRQGTFRAPVGTPVAGNEAP